MAVVKQIYTVSAPWTSFQLADIFRDAFIDAGLMTAWHDSFTTTYTPSGGSQETIQHRVLRIDPVAGKRFGSNYHWFTFRANGHMEWIMAHSWDLGNDRPTGIDNVDYARQTYNPNSDDPTNASHVKFANQVTSITTSLTRYTSTVRNGFSMFLLKGGTNYFCWMFQPPGSVPQPFIDVNKFSSSGLIIPHLTTGLPPQQQDQNTSGRYKPIISFTHVFPLRRNFFTYGASAKTYPTSSYYTIYQGYFGGGVTGIAYQGYYSPSNSENYGDEGPGVFPPYMNDNSSFGFRNRGDSNSQRISTVPLPAIKQASNSFLTSDQTPVFYDLPYSIYYTDRMPFDFGIAFHYTNSSMEVQDIFQVTPGVEEWEILAVENFPGAVNPSPLLLARVI